MSLEFDNKINLLRQNGTLAEKNIISMMDQYIAAAMNPTAFENPNIGSKVQNKLWVLILTTIEKSEVSEFTGLWRLLLSYFDNYRTTYMDDKIVYAHAENWSWDLEELTAFQKIINLMILTCDPQKRAEGFKKQSINRTLESKFSEQGRQRIINFYLV